MQLYEKENEICKIFKNTYFGEPLVSTVTPMFLKILAILKHY